MLLNIYQDEFKVNENEFTKICIENMLVLENLGIFERLISLILEFCQKLNISKLIYVNPTHGGFIPIKIKNKRDCEVYFFEKNEHYINFKYNCENKNLNIIELEKIPSKYSIYKEHKNFCILEIGNENIFITNEYLENYFYLLSDTEYKIYISDNFLNIFKNIFLMYINDDQFYYDNLINLCFMVKNSGEIFEKILQDNIDVFGTNIINNNPNTVIFNQSSSAATFSSTNSGLFITNIVGAAAAGSGTLGNSVGGVFFTPGTFEIRYNTAAT